MWYVYLLECRDGCLYCGITNDKVNRIKLHNAGKASRFTRSRLPVKLIWSVTAHSRSEALKIEYQIKHLSREKKLMLARGYAS